MEKLKEVNVSMGLMLEQLTPRLLETVHKQAPSKVPSLRLQQLIWSGELRIPFTTGLLLGIGETPQERIDSAFEEIETALAAEIVQRVRNLSPKFLEIVVLELLHAMGYGASEAGIQHVGGPGDEGIDGVIHQDTLGLQRIYVQAKRYKTENTIGRPDIQKFVGALAGQGANGGVFITTSNFSTDAIDYANKNLSARIVLIDGADFGRLMVRHGIGVQKQRTYSIVDIDEDYFED
jgi:restriction system protein